MPKFVDDVTVTGAATVSGHSGQVTQKLNRASGQSQDLQQLIDSDGSTVLGSFDVNGVQSAKALAASGLTGATQTSRYVGATASGSPASGTFAVGDFVIDRSGKLWICVTAGSPGTWVGGGGPTPIAETILSGTAASIDFQNIPATYRDLRVVLSGRGDGVATEADVLVRLNNDSAANYDTQRSTMHAAVLDAAESLGGTSFTAGSLPAANATAGKGGSVRIELPDYRSTTFQKIAMCRSAHQRTTSTGDTLIAIRTGVWRSTAAITRVTLLPEGGTNFIAGTVAVLYGMMGVT